MGEDRTIFWTVLAIIIISVALFLGALSCALSSQLNWSAKEYNPQLQSKPRITTTNLIPRTTQNIGSGRCPITVTEGEIVKIRWDTFDPDAHIGPQGFLSTTFEGPIGESGIWQTKKGDVGIHTSKATVFDGEFTDETSLCVEVLETNLPAKLIGSREITVNEGQTVALDSQCWDPDGDKTFITYDGWMNTRTRATKVGEAGNYIVEVTCADTAGAGQSGFVRINVLRGNRPPTVFWTEVNIK